MQLTEVGLDAEPVLLRLMSVAFPDRPSQFWQDGFARMSAHGPSRHIAWLLGDPENPDGVMLALPNPVTGVPSTQATTQINLSSWYVSEDKRGQALWMLRKIASRKNTIFTDLTPTESVVRMLPALGFKPVSAGLVRLFVPQVARRNHSNWNILNNSATIEHTTDPVLAGALRDHHQLGCMVAGLCWQGRCFPVVLARRWRRGLIPTAEIIYLPVAPADMPDLRDAIPALAAHLLRSGVLFLELEQALQTERALTIPHRLVNPNARYARGPYLQGGINHLYSEFVFFKL